MITSRHVIVLLMLVAPLHSLAGQGQTATPPRMTPEQRLAAQSKLNAEVARLNTTPLDAVKAQLRKDVLITRDSVAAAVATASLITRAKSMKSAGVERSQARHLRGQCQAAQRSSAATLKAVVALNTPDAKGTQLLGDYRAALTEVGRRMGECDKVLGAMKNNAPPTSAQITTAIGLVNAAAVRHDRALDNLMRGMEIPLR
jgi:hypothetical protein